MVIQCEVCEKEWLGEWVTICKPCWFEICKKLGIKEKDVLEIDLREFFEG